MLACEPCFIVFCLCLRGCSSLYCVSLSSLVFTYLSSLCKLLLLNLANGILTSILSIHPYASSPQVQVANASSNLAMLMLQ